MSRHKKYLTIDVVTAAKQRIHHLYDIFDSVVVMFSGGKDSLACLHLVHEVAKERGIKHVDVVFRDEELIPNSVIDFVNEYRQLPWVKMRWYAVPLKGEKMILGRVLDYVQWDPVRGRSSAWVRPMPEWAITKTKLTPPKGGAFDQYTMDAECAEHFKGSVAFITGVRAAESLMRYRSVVNKLNENYICGSSSPNVKLCKPIYDWEENDIFKFFMVEKIRYCAVYDAQHVNGQAMRVATPLHSEAAKRIGMLRSGDGEFYQRVLRCFPEMEVQERYWKDIDRSAMLRSYADDGWKGCMRYIEENFSDEGSNANAMKNYKRFIAASKTQPRAYTPTLLLVKLSGGTVKRLLVATKAEAESAQRSIYGRAA